MPWFPDFATPAYVETLKLRRIILERQRRRPSSRPPIVEPAGAEFIAAVAAGINARHIVQIGCGLSTVALAAAARSTGSLVVSLHTQEEKQKLVREHLLLYGLLDYVHFLCGDLCGLVSEREGIDFVYISGDADLFIEIFDLLNLKPGAYVVADNALDDSTNDYIKHVRRQPGVDCSTLPVGRGLEITKIVNWDDFRTGRKRYEGDSVESSSKLVVASDTLVAKSSQPRSESADSVYSNQASVSSAFAAEEWMASTAATLLGEGSAEETDEVETHRHAAQELAFSVNTSVSSIFAAEAWMASQAKAFYTHRADDGQRADEFYELQPDENSAQDLPHSRNGDTTDSDCDEEYANCEDVETPIQPRSGETHDAGITMPRNGFVVGEPDCEDDIKGHAGFREFEVHEDSQLADFDPYIAVYDTQNSLLPFSGRVMALKAGVKRYLKHKSARLLNGTVTGDIELVEGYRSEDSDTGKVFYDACSVGQSVFNEVAHFAPGLDQSVDDEISSRLVDSRQDPQESGSLESVDGPDSHEILPGESLPTTIEREPDFEITFLNEDTYTAVIIRGVDQDMLLFDITMAFNESGVSVRRAKINTTQEKYIEDIFYVVDSKTGAALDISRQDGLRETLLRKLSDHRS